MSGMDASLKTGASVLTGAQAPNTGGAGVTRISSTDGSVTITSPTGPTVDLSVAGLTLVQPPGYDIIVNFNGENSDNASPFWRWETGGGGDAGSGGTWGPGSPGAARVATAASTPFSAGRLTSFHNSIFLGAAGCGRFRMWCYVKGSGGAPTADANLRIGFADDASFPSNGVFFQADNRANWQCITMSGGTTVATSSGVAYSAGSYVLLAIDVDEDGVAHFLINDAQVAAVSSHVPHGVGLRSIPLNSTAANTAPVTPLTLDVVTVRQRWDLTL